VFISWRARGTVGDESLEWTGIDRFRLRDDSLASEADIIFDTAPFLQAGLAGAVGSAG
jgi:hypothetical protein